MLLIDAPCSGSAAPIPSQACVFSARHRLDAASPNTSNDTHEDDAGLDSLNDPFDDDDDDDVEFDSDGSLDDVLSVMVRITR